jgi:hypothetical protein
MLHFNADACYDAGVEVAISDDRVIIYGRKSRDYVENKKTKSNLKTQIHTSITHRLP